MNTMRSLTSAVMLAFWASGCGENGPSSFDQVAAASIGSDPRDDARLRGGCDGLPVYDDSLRVDLYEPSFSDPTQVTNPLFPIGKLDRVLLLGSVDGLPLRVETTLLEGTQMIDLGGQQVETLVSQYVAWLDGRIHEVAIDWYAQDDQGAVWYFGEDVFNYEEGVIADTHGTWLAGRDGPVAMIMPADPQVANVWRPENICGFVFEEVIATSVGVTVDGPRGPVPGAIITEELHMDGTLEDKTFAPAYGEFSTGDPDGDLEAVAVAVPTDALSGPAPAEVEALSSGAEKIFALARSGRWAAVVAEASRMNDAWTAFQATGVPPMLDAQMSDALRGLDEAIGARERAETRQASIRVALASLDFELRHEERAEIDLDLIEVWLRQLQLDVQARDAGAVRGDIASIEWIRDRLTPGRRGPIDRDLQNLEGAAGAADWSRVETTADTLRQALASRVRF
jgi:hypothetical protein